MPFMDPDLIKQELLQNWLLHLHGPGRCPHDLLQLLDLTNMTNVNTALTNVSQSLLDYVQAQSVDLSQEI